MNKTAIKNFAVRARRKLIEEVTHKAYEIGIMEDKIHEIETFEGGFRVKGRENGKTFKKYELKQREKLVQNIRDKGYEQVIEEVAYTWFNRFIALRFMEVNNYLPTGVRVLSSEEEGKTEPDIIKEALSIDLEVEQEIIFRLQDNNDTEDLYKYLLIRQCNQLGKIMPAVFEEIADYTELLLPDKLLAEGSIIRDLVESIEEYDWKIELNEEEKKQESEKGEHGIEIIGWLYQYYISEKKDEVFAGLKKNKKITKENIPAATQLFTPKWIVKYMVENSLGRLWLESHPNEDLKADWKYYLEEAEQEPEVQKQLDELKNPNLNPEEIKVLDPAMGSGHILVYAFDVLYEIYLSAGYSEREIPTLILEKNLYGLDIDDRAGQLACFALLMKARSKNRRIFRNKPNLNLCSIQESNGIPKEAIEYLVSPKETEIEKHLHKEDVEYLINVFHDAKEYGSILDVKEIDFDALESRIEELRDNSPADIFEYQYKEVILERVLPLIQQAKVMGQSYDNVITNPPYMGSRKSMNKAIKSFTEQRYPDSKADLYACFIEQCLKFAKSKFFVSMITQQSFMFTDDYKNLRRKLLDNISIISMNHLGSGVFPEINGEVVQTTSFIIKNLLIDEYKSLFIRLTDFSGEQKEENLTNTNCHYSQYKNYDYKEIDGAPFSYWISWQMKTSFVQNDKFESVGVPRQGLATGNNEAFLRLWHEIKLDDIGFAYESIESFHKSKRKFAPYNKGGKQRRWFGNNEFLIKFDKPNYDILARQGNHLPSKQFYFRKCITWSDISGRKFAGRFCDYGFVFDVKGSSGFPLDEKIYYVLAFLNSKVVPKYIDALNPTLTTQVGDLKRIPVVQASEKDEQIITNIATICVKISQLNWNSFETSWDFTKHPLLVSKMNKITVEEAFNNWSNFTEQQFNQLKQNEEELNRIFIEIYRLQDELTPEVEDKDITINKADRERDIKSFISYAVGCMFGRYSLDEEGLIYAGGDFTDRFRVENGSWEINTNEGWKQSSIDLTKDNVIPITDGDYFEDDILERFVKFLKASLGEEALEENLRYIAETLGKKANETSRQAIRRYFLKDFYKDHVKTYKKRPIYWLFDSGKQNGFKALIYMHRYDPFTVARVRTDYLHRLQKKYEAEINHLDILIDSEVSDREKAAARKRKEVILKQIQECRVYDQSIAHVANQKVEIDLDDGVAVNYAKFQGVKIPQGEGKKPLKADLLAKI